MEAFQAARGLRVDGVCGRHTWSALVEASWNLGDRLLYRRRPMLRGDDVADLQRRLNGFGFDAGRVDGIFGDRTANSLADFQRNVGLPADAICGPSTLRALERLGAPKDRGADVFQMREQERMRRRAGLTDLVVAVGHDGGLDALVASVCRSLTHRGAKTVVLWHPDGSVHASEANGAGADTYVGFSVNPDRAGCATSFYAGFRYESQSGKRLAAILQSSLARAIGVPDLGVHGMSLPVLRETRMPAVLCEIGPAAELVTHIAAVGPAVAAAVDEWTRPDR